MQTKNKKYTLLTIVIAPEKFTDDLGFACARLNTDAEYPHFDLRKNGNVKESAVLYSYQNNHGLKQQEYQTIKHLVHTDYNAINFLVPDPREILRNWRQWRDIFSALPVNILHRSYIVPYEQYFKVKDILPALDELSDRSAISSSVQSLPYTGIPNIDGSIEWFNDWCKQASRDFRADGSVRPIF